MADSIRGRLRGRYVAHHLGGLVLGTFPGDVGLRYDAAAAAVAVHDRYAADVLLFHDVDARLKTVVRRDGRHRNRHTVASSQIHRVFALREGAADDVAVRNDAEDPHGGFVIDDRDRAAVVQDHQGGDTLQIG